MNAKCYLLWFAGVLTVLLMAVFLFIAPGQVTLTLAQGPQGPRPKESHLVRAHSFTRDLRQLPQIKPVKTKRIEREESAVNPVPYETTSISPNVPSAPTPSNLASPYGAQN